MDFGHGFPRIFIGFPIVLRVFEGPMASPWLPGSFWPSLGAPPWPGNEQEAARRKFQVLQEKWQRIPKPELALGNWGSPLTFWDYWKSLGALALGILWSNKEVVKDKDFGRVSTCCQNIVFCITLFRYSIRITRVELLTNQCGLSSLLATIRFYKTFLKFLGFAVINSVLAVINRYQWLDNVW